MTDVKDKVHSDCVVDAKCIYSWLHGTFCLHQLADMILYDCTPNFIEERDKYFVAQKLKEYAGDKLNENKR